MLCFVVLCGFLWLFVLMCEMEKNCFFALKKIPRPREGTLALELPNVRGKKSSSSAPWIIAQAKNSLSLI